MYIYIIYTLILWSATLNLDQLNLPHFFFIFNSHIISLLFAKQFFLLSLIFQVKMEYRLNCFFFSLNSPKLSLHNLLVLISISTRLSSITSSTPPPLTEIVVCNAPKSMMNWEKPLVWSNRPVIKQLGDSGNK